MSTILVNTLTGTSTAGSIAVTGEGNSTTTNLQQGLTKVWATFNASTPALMDSFNVSSLTDNASGDFTLGHTNNFAVANVYAAGGHTAHTNGSSTTTYLTNPRDNVQLLTSSCRYSILYNTSSATGRSDYAYCSTRCNGDLA
tara:strand:- start:319 stop:744 length:426 start_codon:yes stop_codon:yes gene_type:complete